MRRPSPHARQLALHELENLRGFGPEPELVIEPPSPRLDRLGVRVADLVRVEHEGVAAAEGAGGAERAGEDESGLPPSEGLEVVESDGGGAEKAEESPVPDRHAVLEGQVAVRRLQEQPPLRRDPDAGEREPPLPLDEPYVAGVGVLTSFGLLLVPAGIGAFKQHQLLADIERAIDNFFRIRDAREEAGDA